MLNFSDHHLPLKALSLLGLACIPTATSATCGEYRLWCPQAEMMEVDHQHPERPDSGPIQLLQVQAAGGMTGSSVAVHVRDRASLREGARVDVQLM